MVAGFGTRIIPSRLWPKHQTRQYKVIYHTHPMVTKFCWIIRRYLRITPWVEAWYYDDADPKYVAVEDILFCGERTFELLKRKLS